MWPRSHRDMWHGCASLIISLHPAKFDGHRYCAREQILFFVCHATSRDFVVRESCDIMDEFSSSLVTNLQCLVFIYLLEEEILSFQFVTWLHVTTCTEGCVAWWVSFPYHKPLPCQILLEKAFQKRRYCFILFMWPHMPTWSMGYVALWMGASHTKSPPRSSYASFCWKYIIYM